MDPQAERSLFRLSIVLIRFLFSLFTKTKVELLDSDTIPEEDKP